MCNLKGLKLRHQLGILIGIAIVLMILVQLVYYISFHKAAKDKAVIYADNTINQVEENLTVATSSIYKNGFAVAYNKYVQEYLVSQEPLRRIELNAYITDLIRNIFYANSNILDIVLVDRNERVGGFSTAMNNRFFNELRTRHSFDDESFKTPVYSSMLKDEYRPGDIDFALIMPVYGASKDMYSDSKIGTCIILCKTKELQDIVRKTAFTENSLFLILDGDNNIIASSDVSMTGSQFSPVPGLNFKKHEERFTKTYNGSNSIIQYKVMENTGWKAVSIIPVNDLTDDLIYVRNFGFIVGLVMIILMSFIGVLFIRNITNPISEIVEMMKDVGEVNVKKRIHIPLANEVGIIAMDINIMLDKIESMTSRIFKNQTDMYEMEISRRQAELSALQSQINPHFLYNTLESIRCLGLDSDDMKVVQISTAMANIFRYSIKGQEFVRVRDELKCIQDYLDIMNIRFEGRFDMLIDIDERLLEMSMIKMVLQPIVENAVYHGLEQKNGRGSLVIKGRLAEESITFEVIDDGKGIEEKELERLQQLLDEKYCSTGTEATGGRSIGLSNINSRVKLHFGDNYGIRIFSRENEGTRVLIMLPVIAALNP